MKKQLLTFLGGVLCCLNLMAAASENDIVAISGDYTLIADDVTSNGTKSIGKSVLFGDSHFLSDAQGLSATTSDKGNSTIGEESCRNSLRVKNNVMIAFKVSGACHVKVYHQKHSTRTIIINRKYEINKGDVVGEYSSTITEADIAGEQTVYVYSIDKGNTDSGKGDLYIAGIEVTFNATSYNVTYQNDGNGTLTGAATAKAGATVNVTATPNAGYRFDYITVNDTKQTAGATSFIMPNEVATVKAYFAEAINVTGVSLDKTSLDMMQYSQATLTATVAPADATNQNVTWASDNEAVATVNNGVVYAKSVGTAKITVTTEDGNKTATCAVTVSAIPGDVLFSAVPVYGKTLKVVHQATAVEVSDENATITGGKVYLYNGHSSSDADMISAEQFNVAGSGGSYIHLEFDNALKVGDVIVLKDYYGNGVSQADAFYVACSDTKPTTAYSFPYVVNESSPLKDATYIYLWKNVENAVKTIEVYGVVPFDDGSRTLSWTPNLNKSESSIGTASKPAVSATITAASDITNNGSLTITGSAKPDLTSKIESLTEKNADKYMSVSFTMASGNGFCPTTVTVPVQAISYDALVDLVLTDGTNTIEETGLTATNGALENKTITNTNNVIFSGDVTLKIYVYGQTQTAGYRLGAPISIVGFEGTKKSLNASGYASFSNAEDVKVFGADVNKASVAGTTITLTKVDGGEVPANNGVLLSGNASQDYIFCPVQNATAIEGNDLLSTNGASVGSYDWVLSGNQFKRYTGASFDANKAYLHFDTDPFAGSGAKGAFSIVFDGDNTTAVAGVAEAKAEVKAVKFMQNGQLLIKTANGFVNAAGAQVK